VSFRDWFRRKPAPGSGVTLQPGESTEIALPPEIAAAIAQFQREGRKITTEETAPRRGLGGRYTQEVRVLVDGKPWARFEIGFTQ
jgi:hypothetical protein